MRVRQAREAALQNADDGGRIVQRQGRLGDIGQVGGIARLEPFGILRRLDQGDGPFGQLPHGAFDLGVAGVADQHNLAARREMPLGLDMDLGDQRTGCIQVEQLAAAGFGGDRLRHAMGRKDHRPIRRALIEFLDEDRPERTQALDDMAVMDDLMPHEDRRAVLFQRAFNDLDGAIHPGTEAARRGEAHDEMMARRSGVGHPA